MGKNPRPKNAYRCESCHADRRPQDVLEFFCVHPDAPATSAERSYCQRRRYVCRPTDAQASLCFRISVGDQYTHGIREVA